MKNVTHWATFSKKKEKKKARKKEKVEEEEKEKGKIYNHWNIFFLSFDTQMIIIIGDVEQEKYRVRLFHRLTVMIQWLQKRINQGLKENRMMTRVTANLQN